MAFTLITGASSGIGLELAREFAQDGHDLILAARSEDALKNLAEELRRNHSRKVHVVRVDLSVAKDCQKLYDYCQENELKVDNLVNNAGIGDVMAFVDSDWKKQETMIRLNMESLTHLTHLFLPSLVKQGRGGILNVASTAAFQPGPYMAVYYATKSYVLNFSQALNEELKGSGVHVTALCPGPTESGFQKTANMDKSLLFKLANVPSSADVAKYAYKAFKNKKSVAVHGLMNKVMASTTGIIPNFILLKVVKFLNGGK